MNRNRKSWLKRALPAAAAVGALVATLAAAPAATAAVGFVTDPASYVDTFSGTGSGGAVVGTINNFPGAAAPYGMIQFGPANGDNGTGYRNGNTNLQGFATNFASQGCTAFGNFPVLPTTINPTTGSPWSTKNTIITDSEVGEIGYLSLNSTDGLGNLIGAQLTATDRTGVAEFTFPAGTTPAIMVRAGRMNNKDAIKSSFNVNPNNQTMTGWAVSKGFCSATPDNQYRVAFTAKFEQPFTTYGAWNEGTGSITNKVVGTDTTDAQVSQVQKAGGYIQFAPGTTTVRMKISLSFVGNGDLQNWTNAAEGSKPRGGAALNLATEVPTADYAAPGTTPYVDYAAAFDAVRQDTYDRWNELLGKIKVSDTASTRDIGTFYHSLYRTFLHPNVLNDVDGYYPGFETFNYLAAGASGTEIPATIHNLSESNAEYGLNQEKIYGNFSDWDTYRSWAPLAALLTPKEASDMAQTYVLNADQWGMFPRWSIANQSTGQMSGDNATALLAQVYAFGAHDFAADRALYHMNEVVFGENAGEATDSISLRKVTRPDVKDYSARKYAPQTIAHQTDHAVTGASIAQEWSIDDFAAGEFATALGDTEIADKFHERTNYWENHINPLTGCLSARDYAGRFPVGTNCNSTPSDFGFRGTVTGYGQVGFDEAVSEQYLWLAPQNLAGLATILGGQDATAERLDTFMTGGYNVGANVPKMWAGNEPNFATPWAYNYLGRPWRTQEVVEDIRTQLFGTGRDGAEPGNDDLGAMSSWYVWAALGVYPATPGTDILTVNSPNFEKVEMTLGNGNTLTINAPDATSKRYIGGLSVNGIAQTSLAIPDTWQDADTTLDFTMSATATTWGSGADDAPASFDYGSNSVVAYGDQITATPGSTSTVDFAIQRVTANSSTYDLDLTGVPAGFTVSTTKAKRFDSAGHDVQPLKVVVGTGVADGDYTLPVTVLTGDSGEYVAELSVRVARTGGFLAATNLQARSVSAADAGHFDGTSSYQSDKMADLGLVPGEAVDLAEVSGNSALAGLSVKIPVLSDGLADSIVPNGQTITLTGSPTKVSFLGAAKAANTAGTAVVTLDNGATETANLDLGDWVKPSSLGDINTGTLTPYSSNVKVVWVPTRNANGGSGGDPGSYVYATAPYTAPAGRTIASVTLTGSSSDNRRVFAIAQDTPEAAASVPTQAASASTVAAGDTITLTGSGFAPGEAVSVVLGDTAIATGTANAAGVVSIVATIPGLTAPGTHDLRLGGATSGGADASTVTITAATWAPVLNARASITVGNQVVVTGTGFAPGEAITVTLGSESVEAIASASGGLTASIAGPATPGTLTLTATGALSGASATKSITFIELDDNPGEPAPEVALSASAARLTFGESTTVTAQVSAGVTGQVEFFDGTTSVGKSAIAAGKATLALTGLASGSHGISAQLVGTEAKSPTVFVTVIRATSGTVKVTAKKYKRKKAATVTVKVGALSNGRAAAGRVTVYVGKKVGKNVTLTAAAGGTVKVKLAKKFTKKKTLKVRAVFTPADTKNVIGGESVVKVVKAKKAKKAKK